MPYRAFGPTVEVGPFSCIFEDDRCDEPEIIVDPLSGFVVAIVPPSRGPRPPSRREPRRISLWRTALTRWLQLAKIAVDV